MSIITAAITAVGGLGLQAMHGSRPLPVGPCRRQEPSIDATRPIPRPDISMSIITVVKRPPRGRGFGRRVHLGTMRARAGTSDAESHVTAPASASARRIADVTTLSYGRGGQGKALGPRLTVARVAGINPAMLSAGKWPHGRRYFTASPTGRDAARATTRGAARASHAVVEPLTVIKHTMKRRSTLPAPGQIAISIRQRMNSSGNRRNNGRDFLLPIKMTMSMRSAGRGASRRAGGTRHSAGRQRG